MRWAWIRRSDETYFRFICQLADHMAKRRYGMTSSQSEAKIVTFLDNLNVAADQVIFPVADFAYPDMDCFKLDWCLEIATDMMRFWLLHYGPGLANLSREVGSKARELGLQFNDVADLYEYIYLSHIKMELRRR